MGLLYLYLLTFYLYLLHGAGCPDAAKFRLFKIYHIFLYSTVDLTQETRRRRFAGD